ncbi:hypothetical protein C8R44DRAFT_790750 [Mycena epipterygia]|nr:hypothetical protein C8R44DRAFT_790750 [Mycena epipterygia]
MTQVDIAAHIANWNAPIFNGHVHEDVRIWISAIRDGLWERNVPSEHWVNVASHFLGEEPKSGLDNVQQMMEKLQSKDAFTRADQCQCRGEEPPAALDDVRQMTAKPASRQGVWRWDWAMFSRILVHIHDRVKKDAADLAKESQSLGDVVRRFRKQHPYAAAAAGLGLVAAGGITVTPAILVGTLNVMGFSASGIVGGSVAAGIQASVYGGAITSGSMFAMAQSAAAGGIAATSIGAQAVSAGTMALGAWIGLGGAENNAENNVENSVPDES